MIPYRSLLHLDAAGSNGREPDLYDDVADRPQWVFVLKNSFLGGLGKFKPLRPIFP